MDQPTIIFAAAFFVSAACYGQNELEMMTNYSGPPTPPHWYQTVGPGMELPHLSPVEYFRGLLGMTPEEREVVLAGKPPAETKAILGFVREYEALPRAVREARLHQTELHWHVLNLMRLEKSARAAELRLVSPVDQPMILDTLEQWDDLPAATRKVLLEKEDFLRTYLKWAVRSPTGRKRCCKGCLRNGAPAGRRNGNGGKGCRRSRGPRFAGSSGNSSLCRSGSNGKRSTPSPMRKGAIWKARCGPLTGCPQPTGKLALPASANLPP